MKRKMSTVLAGVLAISMLAGMTAHAADHKIGIVVFQEDMFMQMFTAGAVAAAEDYGWDHNEANYGSDPAEFTTLMKTYMDQGYEALALQCDVPEVAYQLLADAAAGGMKIVWPDVVQEENPLEIGKDLVSVLYTAQASLGYDSGTIAAQYIKEKGIEEVNVGIVEFADQGMWASKQRSDNFLKGLEDAGIEYTVVSDQDAHMQDTALTTCTDMLNANPEINIIYGANDGATVGCTMAVKNLGLTDSVAVFGCDATEQILTLLLDDEYSLYGTSGQDAYGMGYAQATITMDAALGNENEDIGKEISYASIPCSRYDTEFVEEYLETLKGYMK